MSDNGDDDKITISWDDLRTRKVDQRIGQMQAVRRNRDYAQMDQSVRREEPKPIRNLFYNTLVYMSVFGLLGGLAAWTCGELLHFRPAARLEAGRMMEGVRQIRQAAAAGKISPEEKTAFLDQLARDGRRNAYFLVYINDALSEQQKHEQLERVAGRDRRKEFISNVLAFGVCGMLIAVFLGVAEPLVSRNIPSAIINGSVGATMGLVGGVVVALFVERLYQALAGSEGDISVLRQVFARVVQWAVVGLFLTIAPGLVMRNLKKLLIGAAGGVMGGIVGGLLFDLAGKIGGGGDAGEAAGRLVGLCAIGLVAGLGSGLIENAARSGWLKVTQGLIAGKQFILYRNPTYIGSSPDNQIYLFKDPQVGRRHAAIHIVRGGFELEDLPLGAVTLINGRPARRTRLRNGDQVQIGETRFLFQEKQPAGAN